MMEQETERKFRQVGRGRRRCEILMGKLVRCACVDVCACVL
jgi:hypothetical protein